MNWPSLLSELQTAGVLVMATPEGDLEVDAPRGVLSAAKLRVLREYKAEIVSLLSPRCPFCKQRGMRTIPRAQIPASFEPDPNAGAVDGDVVDEEEEGEVRPV